MCLSTWNPRLVEDQEFEASMGLKSGSKQERQLSGWGSCPQVWQNEFSVQNLHGGKREQTRDLHTPRPCVHLHIFKYTHIKKSYLPAAATPGCGGAHLWQHLGGRGWQISELEASLVYKVSSRAARTIQRNPVSKKTKKKKKKKKKNIWLSHWYKLEGG